MTIFSTRSLAIVAFFLSGISGLIYQIVWMRLLISVLGATSLAVTTVLIVFMMGLALGARMFSQEKLLVGRPLVLYALLEAGIAAYGAGSLAILRALPDLYASLVLSARFDGSLIPIFRALIALFVLLIPTFLMGATLPVVVRAVSTNISFVGKNVGRVYSINTLGAAVGSISTSVYLIPTFGLRGSIFSAAILNALAAVLALLAHSRRSIGERKRNSPPMQALGEVSVDSLCVLGKQADSPGSDVELYAQRSSSAKSRMVYLLFCCSGFFSLCYEVFWTRHLILILGNNSVFAFSAVLSGVLIGIAVGSELGIIWSNASQTRLASRIAAIFSLSGASTLFMAFVSDFLAQNFLGDFTSLPDFLKCLVILVVPMSLSGACFALCAQYLAYTNRETNSMVGKLYALNTLGCVIGAAMGGLAILPAIGVMRGLILVSLAHFALGQIAVCYCSPGFRERVFVQLGLFVFAPLILVTSLINHYYISILPMRSEPPSFVKASIPPESSIRYWSDDAESTVMVVQTKTNDLHYVVDGDTQAGTEPLSQLHLKLLGHLPALLHPSPRDALLVCLGTGISAGSILTHPVGSLDVVELSRSSFAIQPIFAKWNMNPLNDPRTTGWRDDGRNFLLSTSKQYDIITTDPLDPNDAGMTLLYSQEYYQLVFNHLRNGGMVAQWLPPPPSPGQEEEYKLLIRTFRSVFPDSSIWSGNFTTVMIGRKSLTDSGDRPTLVTMSEFSMRFSESAVATSFESAGVASVEQLLSFFLLGADGLAKYAGSGPIITDDQPLLEFSRRALAGLEPEAKFSSYESIIGKAEHDLGNWISP